MNVDDIDPGDEPKRQREGQTMEPPIVAGWNLAVRFGLELTALGGIGLAAWTATSGPTRWVAAAVVPLAIAVGWGVFNVPGDPSRSGAAPVPVSGRTRLALELLILTGGAAAFASAGRPVIGAATAAVIVAHYAASWNRVRWLVDR